MEQITNFLTELFEKQERDERLVSMVTCWWGSKTVKLGMTQIDKGQISTVKSSQSFECLPLDRALCKRLKCQYCYLFTLEILNLFDTKFYCLKARSVFD